MVQDKPEHIELIIGGLGGHGVLVLGQLLAEGGMPAYKNVLYFPNYGATMRWGDCECTVILSDEDQGVSSPASFNPDILVAMSSTMLERYQKMVKANGLILINSSTIPDKAQREDIDVCYVPATELASQVGTVKIANLVLLGALIQKTDVLPLEAIDEALKKRLGEKVKQDLLELNEKALRQGANYIHNG